MYRDAVAEELSRSDFDAARLGFFQLLRRKRMSPQFIERHGEDLFAQACFEYSRQLAEGRAIRNPPAWIVTCAWHRTVGLLESRDWRPRVLSTERLGELGAEEGGEPGEAFLEADRGRKIREAVERLPANQRRLLALSYFEGESVREAARRLGWSTSKAQRAHEAARRRLRNLLGVEESEELAIEVGLAAFLSLAGGGAARRLQLLGHAEVALELVVHHAGGLGRRLSAAARHAFARVARGSNPPDPPSAGAIGHAGHLTARGPARRVGDVGRRLLTAGTGEAGTAVTGEVGSRAVEVCKGVAACVLGGGAITGALLGGGHHAALPTVHHTRPAKSRQAHPGAGGEAPVARGVVRAQAPQIASVPEESTRAPAPVPHHAASTHTSHTSSKAPHVEAATAAIGTDAARRQTQEEDVEEQFGAFSPGVEEGAQEAVPAQSGPVAEANTTSTPRINAESGTRRRTEEAQAEHQFHGILE